MTKNMPGLVLAFILSSIAWSVQTVVAEPISQANVNAVQEFEVTHPTGANATLNPGQNVLVMVIGLTDNASGCVELFSDAQKTKKIDRFDVNLSKGQSVRHFVSKELDPRWVRIWTYGGSFQVKLDQSDAAQSRHALQANGEKKQAVTTVGEGTPVGISSAPPAVSGDTMVLEDVPLFPGAQVVKTRNYGGNAKVELQTEAAPRKVIEFYQASMVARGWTSVIVMAQTDRGALSLQRPGRQLVFKAKRKKGITKVDIAMVGQ